MNRAMTPRMHALLTACYAPEGVHTGVRVRVTRAGAKNVILVGIKGDAEGSPCTNAEYPALTSDLQRAMGKDYARIEERRIDISKLDKVSCLDRPTHCTAGDGGRNPPAPLALQSNQSACSAHARVSGILLDHACMACVNTLPRRPLEPTPGTARPTPMVG